MVAGSPTVLSSEEVLKRPHKGSVAVAVPEWLLVSAQGSERVRPSWPGATRQHADARCLKPWEACVHAGHV